MFRASELRVEGLGFQRGRTWISICVCLCSPELVFM